MYRRNGAREDPWLSLADHGSQTVIYGEGGHGGWNHYIVNHNGADVYIRWKIEANSLLKHIRNKFNRNINNSHKFFSYFYLFIKAL